MCAQYASTGIDTLKNSYLPHCSVVEFPGAVNNIDVAIGSVGGLATVREVMLSEDASLRLRLCGSYQFQAPLPMQRRRISDLLVKGSRQSDGSWRYKVIAVVNIGFTTEVLTDFIFTPGSRFKFGENAVIGSIEEELAGAHADKTAIPFMPPAFFSRVNVPQPYEFEGNSFVHRIRSKKIEEAPGTGEAKLRSCWNPVHVVKFRHGVTPSIAPKGAEDQLRGRDISLAERLREIFSERPVWLKSALEEKLLPEVYNVTSFQKGLQCVAYYWSGGPWRSAYIRLGWDPRRPENAETAKWLQVIDFRDRFFRQHRAIRDTATAPAPGSGDCHFRTPPANKSQLYQFIDIEDDAIRQIIEAAETTSECTEKNGWLQQVAHEQARERMAVKSELMRRTSISGSLALNLALEAPSTAEARAVADDIARAVADDTARAVEDDTEHVSKRVPSQPPASLAERKPLTQLLQKHVCIDACSFSLCSGNMVISESGSLGLALAPHRLGWIVSEIMTPPGQSEVRVDDLLLAINKEILISGDGVEDADAIHAELQSKMKVALVAAQGKISFVAARTTDLDGDNLPKKRLRLEVVRLLDDIGEKQVARRVHKKVVQDSELLSSRGAQVASRELATHSALPVREALSKPLKRQTCIDASISGEEIARRTRRKIVQSSGSE